MNPARAFLFSLEQIGIKLGLAQITMLVEALGRPDHAFRSIIVAGTNGKGSVSAMIERGLRAAGYRTGLYTSPHLVNIEERFAVNGVSIAPDVFDEAAERVQRAAATLPFPPSFFEATTALALEVFRRAAIDVAVLEVGLGGRLDATNVVHPVAAAITMIDFDHQEYLGHTLEAIAGEKAGVIKPDMLVILGENPTTVEAVVTRACVAAGARLVKAAADVEAEVTMTRGQAAMRLRTPHRTYESLRPRLRGRHQVRNALVAVRMLEELGTASIPVPEDAIRTGVEDVIWPGRLEMLTLGTREVLVDGAHNPAGARALAAYLAEAGPGPVPLVIGVMRDKDLESVVAALVPAASHVVCTAAHSARAAAPAELAAIVIRIAPRLPVFTVDEPMDALRRAAGLGSPVVVAGSLYLAGEIRAGLS